MSFNFFALADGHTQSITVSRKRCCLAENLKSLAISPIYDSAFLKAKILHAETMASFIAVEKQVMVESRCINTALLDMMSVYFAFDIAYPRPLYSLLVFIQHYVLGIRDSQPVPNNVTVLVTALSKF